MLPKVAEMTNFNLWTFNSRGLSRHRRHAGALDDRVRVRMANLTMTNHPIHLHGHDFARHADRWRLGS